MRKITYITHYLPSSERPTGGEQRIKATLKALELVSSKFEVNVVTPAWQPYTSGFRKSGLHFSRLEVSAQTQSLIRDVDSLFGPNPFDMATAILLPFDCKFRGALRQSISSEKIFFSHPFAYTWLEKWPDFYLDAHNIEFLLRGTFPDSSPILSLQEQVSTLERIELSCFQNASAISTTSPLDSQIIKEVSFQTSNVINNGFSLHHKSFMNPSPESMKKRNKVLFVGSSHPPNVAAVQTILDLAKRNPNFEFHLVGRSVDSFLSTTKLSNVKMHSSVSSKQLGNYFNSCAISIIPINSGSGTSIKTIEALGHNHVVVGSEIAFRGIPSYLLSTSVVASHTLQSYSEALNLAMEKWVDKQSEIKGVGENVRREFEWSNISRRLSKQIIEFVLD